MFDAHVHLDFLKNHFPKEGAEPSGLVEYLQASRAEGVTGFAIPGVQADSWAGCVGLAEQYSDFGVVAGVGLHPKFAGQREALLKWDRKGAHFIGETGLDKLLESGVPAEVQEASLLDHLKLADEVGLPIVLHVVQRHARLLSILEAFVEERKTPALRGFVHAFVGSPEIAARYLALGLGLGFGKRALRSPKTMRAFEQAPLQSVLAESDEPTEKSDVPHLCQQLAALRGVPASVVQSQTAQNSRALFSIGTRLG